MIGIANALNAPAFSASMPMMVDRRDLPGAVSLNSAMINGSRILGPALAALLSAVGAEHGAAVPRATPATYLFLIVPLLVIALPMVADEPPRAGLAAADDRHQHRPAADACSAGCCCR